MKHFPARATFSALAMALTLAALPAATAEAQWDFGVRGGYYSDVEEAFLGAELLTPIGPGGWYFNPNVEYVFVDPGDLFSINGDFHYDFWQEGSWNAWLGAGPGVIFRDTGRRRGDETDLGLNLLAGIGARQGATRPYLQGKVVFADETEAVLAVGLRFF
jgi:hypothetical protein